MESMLCLDAPTPICSATPELLQPTRCLKHWNKTETIKAPAYTPNNLFFLLYPINYCIVPIDTDV